jgi:hypothetical protein
MRQTELFRIAEKLHQEHGFVPIPASRKDKRPLGRWKDGQYEFPHDFESRYQENCNLGLLVTKEHIVVDIDNKPPSQKGKTAGIYSTNTGLNDFVALASQHEPIQTLTALTPSGGKHLYFKLTGAEGEQKLKNWACCMQLDGKLIAVDIRVKGGYAMCPPSTKSDSNMCYQWENDNYKVPIAPLPDWILRKVLDSCGKSNAKTKKGESATATVLSDNGEITSEDIKLFRNSEYWQECFKLADATANNVVNITATAPYDCNICDRQHERNSNHPFLVKNGGVLKFICRPSAKDGNPFLREIKRQESVEFAVGPTDGILPAVLAKLHDPKAGQSNQMPLVAYLNHFLCMVAEKTPLIGYRDTMSHEWEFRTVKNTDTVLQPFTVTLPDTASEKKSPEFNPFKMWMKNATMRRYNRRVFDPSYTGERSDRITELNLWRGLPLSPVEEVDKTQIELILAHVEQVLADGDTANNDYIIGWLAHLVQRPHVKTGVALVFTGSQGTGKSVFWEQVGKMIFGPYYLYLNSMDSITNHFNAHTNNKLLTVGDEVTWAGCHKANNLLKSKITQTHQLLEQKGVDAVEFDDYQNYVFLSNNDDAVKIEETDRRYFVSKTSNKYARNNPYFDNLATELKSKQSMEHFYTYLLRYDLSNFNIRNIPHTKAKLEMAACKDAVFHYVEEIMEGGNCFIKRGSENTVNMKDLYKHFQTLKNPNGKLEDNVKPQGFGKKLRKYFEARGVNVESDPTKNKAGGVILTIDLSHLPAHLDPVDWGLGSL